MQKQYIINGGNPLSGEVVISGAKNVATKAVIAACLTRDPVILHNVPDISDIDALLDVIESIGGTAVRNNDTVTITVPEIKNNTISLSEGARVRTSSLFISPLLLRTGSALIPNPEGCRLGARPIDRHIEGLEKMGAKIVYKSEDGYYHASSPDGLVGVEYTFEKNSHTGTETLIMAAALARGTTVLKNAAEEHEIDDLILLLNNMGANIKRSGSREITIHGVEELHGTTHTIVSDGNELVTFAVLSLISGGNIFLKNAQLSQVEPFLDAMRKIGGNYEETEKGVRFFCYDKLTASEIVTSIEPGFKTDWQGPWAVLMTQATGISVIHEAIYENRFGYVSELKKMGAKIDFFEPKVDNPEEFYNFNYDKSEKYLQAIKILGPQQLHNAIVQISDLRAGATIVMAALIAKGESVILGVEHLDRGYENFDTRLKEIGADILVIKED